jgi:protein SCO1/2
MISKSTIKTAIQATILMGLLIIPYLMTKKNRDFNPLTLSLPTDTGEITLGELKKENKLVLMYFGFLSCPDICPTTLSLMARVFKDIPKDKLDNITFLFIDLDPERDKLSDLRTYTSFFDTKTIPVSLSLENLERFTRFFGVAFMKVPLESQMGYTIDHSTDIIMISPKGEVLPPIHHNSPKSVVSVQINDALKKYFE